MDKLPAHAELPDPLIMLDGTRVATKEDWLQKRRPELKNLFNIEQMSGFNSVVTTDAAGNPTTPIPSDPYGFPGATGYEQRKFQLGFKVRF